MEEKESYGKITVGYGTDQQKELEVVDYVQANYEDSRSVHVATIKDDSIYVTVENYISTGRAPQQSIWLSKESFVALLATAHMYLQIKGIDITKEVKEIIEGDSLQYSFSDNLKPIE